MYFHVCETQRTRMHVTDTTATPNGHQVAVVTWDRSVAESAPLPLLCWESTGSLWFGAHKAQYCRKCIHAFTDPLCWETTSCLWFTRTHGPILQKVYPCLYWPTVLRIHGQSVVWRTQGPILQKVHPCLYWPTVLRNHELSVVYSHTWPNIAESVSMPLLTHCAENLRAVCG